MGANTPLLNQQAPRSCHNRISPLLIDPCTEYGFRFETCINHTMRLMPTDRNASTPFLETPPNVLCLCAHCIIVAVILQHNADYSISMAGAPCVDVRHAKMKTKKRNQHGCLYGRNSTDPCKFNITSHKICKHGYLKATIIAV